MISTISNDQTHAEMSTDPRFRRRLRRLVVVSAVMLGWLTLLALLATEAEPTTIWLLAVGWVLMPTVLYASLDRPRLRYLLALPASLVAVGLVFVATGDLTSPVATLGWWSITAGILLGGGLGMWLWYRWMPVPSALDDPFSPGRIALIAGHVSLILVGVALVIAA